MSNSSDPDPEKAEWAGRLCALLLNDGTDAMRWFLQENLPRIEGCEPNLPQLLKENRKLFLDLMKGDHPFINQEMFDILFREDEEDVNCGDLEIYLIFVLIRFLCRLKHPDWKWWDEEPLNHQVTPVFDIIRLFRFKQRMRDIVHDYEITEDSFKESLSYVTSVLDRLNCYKISSRRWRDDVIGNRERDYVTSNYIKLTELMRWQTLDLSERDAIYLTLKESREHVYKDKLRVQSWCEFISHFGQNRISELSRLDRPKSSRSDKCVTEGDFLVTNYNDASISPACELNETNKQDLIGGHTDAPRITDLKLKIADVLTEEESQILSRVNNDVFIKDQYTSLDPVTSPSNIQEHLRKIYVTRCCDVTPLCALSHYRLHADDIAINVSRLVSESHSVSTSQGDLPLLGLEQKPLHSWRDMLPCAVPARLVVCGDWSCGKTTLLRTISYEWATCNCPQLTSYRFVFHVDLALIKAREPYTSLSECIAEQIGDFTVGQIHALFHASNGSGILLLFDGVERMPDANADVMSEISDVICGNRWPDCSVIMTTTNCSTLNKPESKLSDEDRNLHKNINFLVSRSTTKWTSFRVTGFSKHDVITHAKHYFQSTVRTDPVLKARQFLNYARIFQRDVYKATMASPKLIYMLSLMWTSCTAEAEPSGIDISGTNLGETLSCVVKWHFDGLKVHNEEATFPGEVLERTLSGNCGNYYFVTLTEAMKSMMRRGLLEEVESDDGTMVRFTHALFEEYCAAQFLCLTFSEDDDLLGFLEENITSLNSSIRLRHFLLFCCSLSNGVADVIISLMSELIQRNDRKTDHQDVDTVGLLEAGKQLSIQCFYEMNAVSSNSFLSSNTADETYEKGGSDLRILRTSSLSHRSRQAILYLTAHCRPTLARSGTVFPYIGRSQFWIRTVRLSGMRGKQMSFVAKLLGNLPFLEEARFDEVRNVADDDVVSLCSGLCACKTSHTSSALHTLIFTVDLMASFGMCNVTSYADLGRSIESLPYLDKLEVTIPTSSLFFSLFQYGNEAVIPLRVINLSRTGFDAAQCRQLASILHRLVFVEKLVLEHNPLGDGFRYICDQLDHFRHLQVIDVSKACLTCDSLHGLARALCRPKTGRALRHLDISGNQVQDTEVALIICRAIEHLTMLEYLDLSDNYLGDNSVCALAKSLDGHRHIISLRLNSVQIGPIALSSLRQKLRDCPSLSRLCLSGNYLDPDVLKFVDALRPKSESSGVCGLHNLQELDLSGISDNLFVTVTSQSIKTFMSSIQKHPTIKCIRLRHIAIDSSDLIRVLELYQEHPSLRELQ